MSRAIICSKENKGTIEIRERCDVNTYTHTYYTPAYNTLSQIKCIFTKKLAHETLLIGPGHQLAKLFDSYAYINGVWILLLGVVKE